jgi:hypothetical protein
MTETKKPKKKKETAVDSSNTPLLLPPTLIETLGNKTSALIFSAIYALVVLSIALVYHTVGDYNIETDFFWGYAPHARMIQNLITGNGGEMPIDPFRGPLYPMVLALVGFIIRDQFIAGMVIGTVCGGLAIYFTNRLVARYFSAAAAIVVSLVLATNSVFIQYCYSSGTDMFFNLVATLAILACLNALQESSPKTLVLAGLFTGFALLTRQNSIFIIAGFLISLAALNPQKKSWTERAVAAAIMVGTALVVFSPWGFFTLAAKGKFFYSENHLNIAKDLFGRETNWDAFWSVKSKEFTSLGDVILADPGKFIGNTLANIPAHFLGDMNDLMTWGLGIFIVLGIIASAVRRDWTKLQLAYFIFAALHFSVLLLVFYGARFSMNLVAPYTLLALMFFTWQTIPRAATYALYAGMIVAFFVAIKYHRENIDSGPKELLVLREKFFQVTQRPETEWSADTVIARKPHVAYYLNLQMGGFPYVNTYDELIAACRKQHAKFLYYSYWEAQMRPQFQFLFNVQSPPPELEPVLIMEQPAAVLYRIKE